MNNNFVLLEFDIYYLDNHVTRLFNIRKLVITGIVAYRHLAQLNK